MGLLAHASQHNNREREEEESHKEHEDVNQQEVGATLLNTRFSTQLSLLTPQHRHGEEVSNKAVDRIEDSDIPDPHEVDSEADHSQQDSGSDPLDDMVDAQQKNSRVKHSR